jgi:hypothetical protein
MRFKATMRLVALGTALLCLGGPAGGSTISGGTPITTIAGHSTTLGDSGDGGPAIDALLRGPVGVAVDAAGNVFFAMDSKIRRVDAVTRIITTIAGQVGCGPEADGGPATAAALCVPYGIVVAPNGDVIVAEEFRSVVRRISAATGLISRVAGTGVIGSSGDGGPAVLANLNGPAGLALDGDGNVYVDDIFDNRIRKIAAATGIITTVAGSGARGFAGDGGPAALALLNRPSGVAVDPFGNLFIADRDNCRVRRVDAATQTITTVAGSGVCVTFGSGPGTVPGDLGPATAAPLGAPTVVAVDSGGNLYVTDFARIRKVDAVSGIISTIAGTGAIGISGDGGPAAAAPLQRPGGMGFDRLGNLYVSDVSVIRKIAADDVPLVGDIDGDGRADLAMWRPETATWYWLTSSSGYAYSAAGSTQWGSAALGDVPLLADVDGDGRADPIVWRASTGTWYWLTSSTGYSYASAGARQWGASGDKPFAADVDGDGKMDLVVWRPSTGTWYWLTSTTGYSYAASGARQWGNQALGDMPLTGDLDGDGLADLIVWRGSSGVFEWLTSADGYRSADSRSWGNRALGDVPAVADMDGDRKGDLAVWRASTGTWFWLTAASGWTDTASNQAQWGNQALADAPRLADFDGDGRADPSVWRASSGTWYWILSSQRFAQTSVRVRQWGS